MRFLGVGTSCDLAALYRRLVEEGHEVRVSIAEPMCHGVLAGMVERVDDWRAALPWLRAGGPSPADAILLFEDAASGALQDELRGSGFGVIGGSAGGDRLEKDRAYAQGVLRDLDLNVAGSWGFEDFAAARAFVTARPARYVLKFDRPDFGAAGTTVGRLADGRDILAMLHARERMVGGEPARFILMEHVEGVEMGVGAYFDGERWMGPACLDWEHKRFFPGDLGEMVGEMGTVATFEGSARFFDATLAKVEPLLRETGYCGYINLNTIVNEAGIWPLEFTCRFGYPGFAVLEPLQATRWSDLFRAMVARSGEPLRVRPGHSVGVVLTTRPFPFIRHYVPEPVGLPIILDQPLLDDPDAAAHLHYGEVGLEDGQLVTAGYHGWTMVVTGTGPDIGVARDAAYARAANVVVPNLRYRNDIGGRLIAGDLERVRRLGWFG